MRWLTLAIIVGLLVFSGSGVASLIGGEPCSGYELTENGEADGACPPTCVTCGCCAQAAEAVALGISMSPDMPMPDPPAVLPDTLNANPQGILHVPKPAFA